MAETPAESIADALERAASAYEALAERAEEVEEEWQYVSDLRDAYLPAIRTLEPAASIDVAAAAEAVDELIAEAGLIADPHKAIDWLSTFPHVLALAVGDSVDEPVDTPLDAAAGDEPDEPDDDSPFRMLLRDGR